MRHLKLSLAVSLALTAGLGHAESQWDDYVEVPAIKDRTVGKWLTCLPGTRFNTNLETDWCYTRGLVSERSGHPRSMDVQAMLELHTTAPVGYRLVARGPLPVPSRTWHYDPATVLIAYKLEPLQK